MDQAVAGHDPHSRATVRSSSFCYILLTSVLQINEECTKCHAKEVTFHTMQLRSADEGQTVFYHCLKCGYGPNLLFCAALIAF